jgi:hypothetical protein
MQLNIEPLEIELGLLSITINMVLTILCQVVKLLGVLVHRTVSLTQLYKLNKLAAHSAH